MVEHQGTCFAEGQRPIVIVCKDARDWIDPESIMFYTGFKKCDISMITKNNMDKFQNCVIVLDDMGDKLNKDIDIILLMVDIIIFK